MANPGFGFRRFIKEIHGRNRSRSESVTLRLFEIHKHETGIDPFEILQDTSEIRMVSENEFKRITGEKYVPKGYARAVGGRPSKANEGFGKGAWKQGEGMANIPLPPQYFDWLDVSEISEEDAEEISENRIKRLNIASLFDFEMVIRMHDEQKMTVSQISQETGVSERRLARFLSKMEDYDEHGVAYQWLAVMEQLWKIQEHRGRTHREDDLMMDLRGIFLDYEKDPVNEEEPSIEDVNWVYSQLLSEEE